MIMETEKKPQEEEKPQRITLNKKQYTLTDNTVLKIEKLKNNFGNTTYSGVVSTAIAALEVLIDAQNEGASIYIDRGEDANPQEIKFVF